MPKVEVSLGLDGIEKLRELTLYVSRASEADEPFSSTKLNKLLFYIDFSAYWDFGKPITGEEYQRLDHGPAPRRMLPLLRQMQIEPAELVLVDRDFHGRNQKRPIAKREPNLSLFSAKEIALADKLLLKAWGLTATQVSDLSHQLPCWKLARAHDTIPFSAGLLYDRDVTPEEVKYVVSLDLSGVADALGI